MSTDAILIVCFIALIIILIVLLIAFLAASGRNAIPKERRKDISFNAGADVDSGVVNMQRNAGGFNKRPQGTILISSDGTVVGVNDGGRAFPTATIRRLQDNAVFEIPLNGEVTLGRIPNSFIEGYFCVTNMSDVSKYHCTLRAGNNGEVLIADNNSTNHTYVNGARIEGMAALRRGDVFRLGQHCEFMLM